jgi:2-oxoisovalerate dehydrogenase E1 component
LTDRVIEIALQIRKVELEILRRFKAGELTGTIHLSIGQELIDTSIIAAFDNPMVFGNHRSHGQYIAATGDVDGLIRQIENGMSQHLYFPEKFISHGIQAALLPVAYGYASGSGRHVISFVGDGTLGQGTLYETLGLLQRRPARQTIVVMDNGYSMSATEKRPDVLLLGKSFGIPVTEWREDAVIKPLDGPQIIYAPCVRLCGHSCNDTEMYRPPEERTEEFRQSHDPLRKYVASK